MSCTSIIAIRSAGRAVNVDGACIGRAGELSQLLISLAACRRWYFGLLISVLVGRGGLLNTPGPGSLFWLAKAARHP
jgi:hypothetical protein